ncbi:type I restriction-modification system deoxyribonuclease [Tateyamaria omphalii]|uniref:type I restriction-modification system endonuclease n=1 Tax=Tateyamaria omphalii TaxID=299262 RepID=UPI001676A5D9|nr:type I restriction-modification system endonuclease [Tateyamaria omphalii]GGX51330.1 type I restriction-modification system deoxyribonuclease [Tateyamaria omphalii]
MNATESNFQFLDILDEQLVNLGRLAESYFHDDPSTSIIKLRQFCEHLTQRHAAKAGIEFEAGESQSELLRTLKFERAAPERVLDVLHHIRKLGNEAVHRGKGNHRQALTALKMCVQLGVWHVRSATRDSTFKVPPFLPPTAPEQVVVELRNEIDRLRAERNDAISTAQKAAEAEQAAQRAAETASERANREAEERRIWEALAQEAEANLNDFVSKASKDDKLEQSAFLSASMSADGAIDLDEQSTRALIDQQLRDRGWEADSIELRHSKGTRPVKGRNMAIAEWPTEHGPADYALFVGEVCLGIVEAKRYRKNVSAAIDQAERYSAGFGAQGSAQIWDERFRVPFLFATNARPYLKQVETESGIWFRDARRAQNHRRALMDWFTPDELASQMEVEKEAAQEALKARSFDFGFQLRPYQKAAIQKVEETLSTEQREMLVAMATGTGKTKLAIAMLYRLLSTKRFRRVCFVVDRSALGTQTSDEFMSTAIEGPKTFGQLFGIKGLEDIKPDPETRVHICTIQGLVKRVLYNDEPADVPPIGQYDLMVIDECHRGYLLDREMSDAELSFRSQDDYVSKYRRVLEYFDAVKIGLTATPALHTAQIFGEPIYTYTYREAVVDGWLIDHEPPTRFETALSAAGIKFEAGEAMEVLDASTGEIDETTAPDELSFQVEAFNRKVITKPFNRVVAEELAKHIDPSLEGKTLIFAVTDAHADIVVAELKKAFAAQYGEIEDAAIRKITGSVDKVGKLIRSFRNDAFPQIAVTVDLLTTGIDVPKITNLVFIRRVNSRILYEQMLGRATRRCDEIGKDVFRIFDAVDLYASLQDMTQMKPVASNPSLRFEQLFDELAVVEEAEQQELIRDQILAKLHRKLRNMPSKINEALTEATGETAEQLRDRLRNASPKATAEYAKKYTSIGKILDWKPEGSGPNLIPISEHEDEMRSVTTGYGDYSKPEDFLDTFSSYVKNNQNQIAALNVVVQRPRDLTRGQLRSLRLELDKMGFSETSLRKAWSDASNEDIAASIIGFIRQAAIGDPLIPFDERVQAATKAILSKASWTSPQKTWLRRIADQIAQEIVVDREAIDQGTFQAQGGFNRLNKVFNGQLEAILSDFNEELWKTSA